MLHYKDNPDGTYSNYVLVRENYSKTIELAKNEALTSTRRMLETDWIPCGAFTYLTVTCGFTNDQKSTSIDVVWSHDGENEHGKQSSAVPRDDDEQNKVVTVRIAGSHFKLIINSYDVENIEISSAHARLTVL